MIGLNSDPNVLLALSPDRIVTSLIYRMLKGENCVLKIAANQLNIKLESLAIYAISRAIIKRKGLCCVIALKNWASVTSLAKLLNQYSSHAGITVSIQRSVKSTYADKDAQLTIILTCVNLFSDCNKLKNFETSTFFAVDCYNGETIKNFSTFFATINKNQKIIYSDSTINLEDKQNGYLAHLKAISAVYFYVTKDGCLISHKIAQPNQLKSTIKNLVKDKHSIKETFHETANFHFDEKKSLVVYTEDKNEQVTPFYISCILKKLKTEIKSLQSIVLCNAKKVRFVLDALQKDAKYHSIDIKISSNMPSSGDQVLIATSGLNACTLNQTGSGLKIIANERPVLSLLENNKITVLDCEIVVVDNAETILHHSYNNSVEKVLKTLKKTKQTLLFASELNTDVENFVKNNMLSNTVTLNFLITNTTTQNNTNPIAIMPKVAQLSKSIEQIAISQPKQNISSSNKGSISATMSAQSIPLKTDKFKSLTDLEMSLMSTANGPRLLLNNEKRWLDDVPLDFDFLNVDLDSIKKSFDELDLKDILKFDENIIDELNDINGIKRKNIESIKIEPKETTSTDFVESSEKYDDSENSDASDAESSETDLILTKQEFRADSNEFLDQLLRDAES